MNRRARVLSKLRNALRARRCRLRGLLIGSLLLDKCGNGALFGKDVLVVGGERIRVGSAVSVADRVWLNVEGPSDAGIAIDIGDRVGIGRDCVVSAACSVTIGSDVTIAPRVFITDHQHAFDDPTRPIAVQGIAQPRPVTVHDGAWIGIAAVIMPGVVIGKNAVVGSNSVVTRDVPDGAIVAGAPARAILGTQHGPSE